MKFIYIIFVLLITTTLLFGQYNYGLEVESQDAKIEGKLNLDSGNSNLFIGLNAGVSNIPGGPNDEGLYNTFIGEFAGRDNTIGKVNTFVGRLSGLLNTTEAFNSFFGSGAGIRNTTAVANTFIGSNTGRDIATGGFNTMVGSAAGLVNVTGINNVFLGANSGRNNTGDRNTFLGDFCRPHTGPMIICL